MTNDIQSEVPQPSSNVNKKVTPAFLVRSGVLLLAVISQVFFISRNYEDWALLLTQLGYSLWVLSPFLMFWVITRWSKNSFFPALTGIGLLSLHGLIFYAYFSSHSSTAALIFIWSPIYEFVFFGILSLVYLSGVVLHEVAGKRRNLLSPAGGAAAAFMSIFVLAVLFLLVAGAFLYVANSERTSQKTLGWIARGFWGTMGPFPSALAKNPSTSTDVLWVLSKSSSRYVIRDVGVHANASADLLAHIARSTTDYARLSGVARNPKTPSNVLQEIMDKTPQENRATRKSWSQSSLYVSFVWPGLAGNPSTPVGVLKQLSEADIEHLLDELAENPSSTCDILKAVADRERNRYWYSKLEMRLNRDACPWFVKQRKEKELIASNFPETSDFRKTADAELVGVWGKYTGKHGGLVSDVRFSPDGQYLLSGGSKDDGLVRLWDFNTGKLARSFKWIWGTVHLAFSDDGQRIVGGNSYGSLTVWRFSEPKEVWVKDTPKDPIFAVAFAQDGETVISASQSGLKTWSVRDGMQLTTFTNDKQFETGAIAEAGDNACLQEKGKTGIEIWTVGTQNIAKTLRTPKTARCGIFTASGKQVVFHLNTKSLLLWDIGADRAVRTFSISKGSIQAIATSGNGAILAASNEHGQVYMWNIHDGKLQRTISRESPITSLAISRDGQKLGLGHKDQTVQVFDVKANRDLWSVVHGQTSIADLTLSSDEKYLVARTKVGDQRLYGLQDGTIRSMDHKTRLKMIGKGTAPKVTVEVTKEKVLHVRENSKELLQFGNGIKDVLAAQVFPKSPWIVTGMDDKTLRLWSIETGKELKKFDGTSRQTIAIAVSPSENLVATGMIEPMIAVWDVRNAKWFYEIDLESSDDIATALTFTRDEKTLYVGTGRGMVFAFDLLLKSPVAKSQ